MNMLTSRPLLLAAATLVAASTAHAADNIWNGSTSAVWGTAANWTGGVPDTATERAVFNGTGSQNAVTFEATMGTGFGGVLVQSGQTSPLSINSTATAGAVFRLAANSGIALESGAAAFSMGTTGSAFQLYATAAGTAIFQNNSANTATLGDKITLYGITGTVLRFTGSGDWQVSSILDGAANVSYVKDGAGTLLINGSLGSTIANPFSGGLKINQGAVTLDFANLATPTDLIKNTNALTLAGGTLNIKGKTGAFTTAQTVASLTLTGGASLISVDENGGTATNLTLGAITRSSNGTLDFVLPTAGAITTTTGVTNGILGAWATVGSGAGTRYATKSGNNIVALTGTAAADANDFTTATENYDFSTTGTTVLNASKTANTVRYTGTGGTIDLSTTAVAQNLTVTGLLNAGTGLLTIRRTLGTGTLVNATELVVNAANADISIDAPISGAGALTKTGANTLTLSGVNTYTGATTVNAGKLAIVTGGSVTGGASNFEVNGGGSLEISGTLTMNGAGGLRIGNQRAAGTATVDVKSGGVVNFTGTGGSHLIIGQATAGMDAVMNVAGTVSVTGSQSDIYVVNGSTLGPSTGTLNVLSGGLVSFAGRATNIASGSGSGSAVGFLLARGGNGTGIVNLETGGTIATNTKIVNGAGTGNFNFNGGTLKALSNNAGLDVTTTTINSGGAIVDTNGFNLTITDALAAGTGIGGLTKTGAGTLTLSGANTYVGNTTVNAGTVTLTSAGSLLFKVQNGNVSNSIGGAGTLTLDGTLNLDISAFTDGTGNWTLISASLNKSYGSNFVLKFNGGSAFTNNSGVWTNGDWSFDQTTGVLTAVPEPSTYGLIGAGALAAVAMVRRRRKLAGAGVA